MRCTVLARHGAMRTIGTFATSAKNLRLGDKCVLRSSRGTEWGEVASDPKRADEEPAPKTDGTILRRVTPQDHERLEHIEEVEQPNEYAFCVAHIRERGLPMRLAGVEHIFGGEKIIFYFLADGRVDFRQLVKDLASEYRTRIEMRQIGVRDEARLLAEYEHCGRELCCRTFMDNLEPVTMRMAKLQKTTLDPAKISGRCGRLMCCLRFEDETYTALKAALPKRGTRVRLAQGAGDVVGSEILAQTVTVQMPDGRTVRVDLSDILEVLPEGAEGQPRSDDGSGRESGRAERGARRGRSRRRSGGRSKRRPGGPQQADRKAEAPRGPSGPRDRAQKPPGPGKDPTREKGRKPTEPRPEQPPTDEWWEPSEDGEK